MRILVDINHPAHVHLFRNAIREWKARGHQVLITARDKDVTLELLRDAQLDFVRTAPVRNGLASFVYGVLELDWQVWKAVRRFKPDVMMGTSFAIAHISRINPAWSLVFAEDSIEASRLFWSITLPFADRVVIPDSIPDDFGRGQVKYPSLHELAYLHPNQFTPDAAVLKDEGLSLGEPFSILRFVSFGASHDIRQTGLHGELRTKVIELLQKNGRIIISAEGDLPPELQSYRMKASPNKLHHLLAFAQLLVGDSQTMTIEAAVLGTPAVRFNSFVGRTPVIEELEGRYGLTYGFKPHQGQQLMDTLDELLAMPDLRSEWASRRKRMLSDKVDLTQWMVRYVENVRNSE